MRKIAVILYGPPGGGKGTQANLLASELGLIHFETGKFCEQVVHDPARQNDPIIARERELWESGKLNTPGWALELVTVETRTIGRAGLSLVFSGSPRTLYEAFDDSDREGEVDVLAKEYSREHIAFIMLTVASATSVFRNSNRKICSICNTGVLYDEKDHKHTACPVCGGALERRKLDTPEVIEIRLGEYRERTEPIFGGLRKRGYILHEINGERKPYEVFADIVKIVDAV